MKLGTMTSSGGLSWDLTAEDALWLGRAIWGEGIPDGVHVGSTMLRRLAYVSDRRGTPAWGSLSELLHGDRDGDGEHDPGEAGYSQPIAVQWRTRGTAAQIARRARARGLSWEELPAGVRQVVLELLTGRRRLTMPGAIHFADRATTEAFLSANPGSRIVGRGLNHFVSMPGSVGYVDPVIVAAAGAPPSSQGGRAALLGAAAVVGLVVL